MFCYAYIKMRSLFANRNVQHSLTGYFRCQFKVEHTLTVWGNGRCKAFTTGTQQCSRLIGRQWLEIGQCRCIKSDTCLLAYLESLMLQEKLCIVRISRVTVSMYMLLVNLGTLVSVACSSAENSYSYQY